MHRLSGAGVVLRRLRNPVRRKPRQHIHVVGAFYFLRTPSSTNISAPLYACKYIRRHSFLLCQADPFSGCTPNSHSRLFSPAKAIRAFCAMASLLRPRQFALHPDSRNPFISVPVMPHFLLLRVYRSRQTDNVFLLARCLNLCSCK